MTIDELKSWAASQPETEITELELSFAFNWLMLHGPSSSWTNTEAKLVRVLLLEVLRGK